MSPQPSSPRRGGHRPRQQHTVPERLSSYGDRFAAAPVWGYWLVGFAVVLIGLLLYVLVTAVPMDFYEQLIFGLTGLVVAILLSKIPGRLVSLLLILLSTAVSTRYLWWRLTETAGFDSIFESVLGYGLIAAEVYAFVIMLLGYFQTAWPLRRRPVEMPADVASWPTVDVFIPTYNEPLHVVRPTVLAALALDWPAEKLRVYVLDDGKRQEFKQFAEEAGAGYLTRSDNKHAKAGNINAALRNTRGEFVAVFDCDHIPTRSFLQVTMGQFLRDRNLGILQTPHHFFSPDPFEKNLNTFRKVPNEDELFYGLVQAGNDLWNAAFFCGSCAVMRRDALEEVGGVATDTLTEDAHTSILLHKAGYSSAYIGIPQASGLATETLRDHVRQRSRWARGMAQIFRIDNPIFARGLTFAQRLCYSNAMLHFFYGLPRLVFLTAPLAFLFFGSHVYKATAFMVAVFALPHLLHAQIAGSRLNGKYRHSFWAEVFETTLAWHVMRAAIVGVLFPKRGAFVVTPKGSGVDREYFDWGTSMPLVILFVLNIIGLVFGVIRGMWWNAHELDTVVMNMLWTCFNLVVLGAGLAVAREVHQSRANHRVAVRLPAALTLHSGRAISCEVADFSEGGVCLRTPTRMHLNHGDSVVVTLMRGEREFSFPAKVAFSEQDRQGLSFEPLSLAQQQELLQCTFSRADAWLRWGEMRQKDSPLRGFGEVLSASVLGVRSLLRSIFGGRERDSGADRTAASSR